MDVDELEPGKSRWFNNSRGSNTHTLILASRDEGQIGAGMVGAGTNESLTPTVSRSGDFMET